MAGPNRNATWLANVDVNEVLDQHSHEIEVTNRCAYCDEDYPCPTFHLAQEVLRTRRVPKERPLTKEARF